MLRCKQGLDATDEQSDTLLPAEEPPLSLLGRLEDLSLTDIIQIVFLSRRTGLLEIIDSHGRHTVLFRHGLVVNASSPVSPDLISYLEANKLVAWDMIRMLRQTEILGVAAGTAVLDMNLLSSDDLAAVVLQRITGIVTPLLSSRDGEFNFILSDAVDQRDLEYDVDKLFREGGIAPQAIIGGEGEKLKPLRGLEESMKIGKALLRGESAPTAPPETEVVDSGPPLEQIEEAEEADSAEPFAVPSPEPFPESETPQVLTEPRAGNEPSMPADEHEHRARAKFTVAADSPIEDESIRNVVLFERDALVRVAVRRAFTRKGVNVAQFGSIGDTRQAIADLFRANRFFVAFLNLQEGGDEQNDESVLLLRGIKRKNARLPVVMVDREVDLKRRHLLLKEGADLYLTKPSAARLQPGLAEEELAIFADELVLFSERVFERKRDDDGDSVPSAETREKTRQQNLDRSFVLLKKLINELSSPDDISQVSLTVLRVAAEYLERGVLFILGGDSFVALGGFGKTGDEVEMTRRARQVRISRNDPSVLKDVFASQSAHRGKLQRSPANIELIEKLGVVRPTEVIVIPIMNRGDVIGLLYGDNAETHSPIETVEGLEIFLAQSGFALENAVISQTRQKKLSVEES